jgi:hypothetical protein
MRRESEETGYRPTDRFLRAFPPALL